MMSRIAAPSSEVTIPILRGSVDQPFLLQEFLELVERELPRAETVRLEVLADELVFAFRLIH